MLSVHLSHSSIIFRLCFSCQTMPVAMALLRDVQNLCPKDVLNFILDLIKYNDNRKNKVMAHIMNLNTYLKLQFVKCHLTDTSLTPHVCLQFSDNYYRAELIEALTNSLTPAISINNEVRTVDNLNADVRLILEEITRYLNMEKLLPSFRHTITVRYREKFPSNLTCIRLFKIST